MTSLCILLFGVRVAGVSAQDDEPHEIQPNGAGDFAFPQDVVGSYRLNGYVRGEDLDLALRGILAGTSRADETPPELYDPAFEKYVNMSSVGAAWHGQDPAALADGALQILEGERILLRPHEKLPGEKVLLLAGKLAAEKKDAATLERVKKAAELHGKKEVAANLAAAGKLAAAAARGDEDEALVISVAETTLAEYGRCRAFLDKIQAAKVAGDGDSLKNVQDEIRACSDLSVPKREQLLTHVEKVVKRLPQKQAADPAVSALAKLGAKSRDYADGWAIEDTGPGSNMCLIRNETRRSATIFVNTRGQHWQPVTVGSQGMAVSVPSRVRFNNNQGHIREVVPQGNRFYTLYIDDNGAMEMRWRN